MSNFIDLKKTEKKNDVLSLSKVLLYRTGIQSLNDNINSTVLFTHNDSCNFLVTHFYNQSIHVPTSSILVFDFNVNLWKDIKEANSFRYYFPKDYR